jgi:uncharacterized protein
MKLSLYPDIVKDWHPTKNGELTPDDFTHGSHTKVWWKCPKECDHEWHAQINSRVNGRGCPFCSGHKVSQSNSFLMRFPNIAAEWHPTNNGVLKPEQFTSGSDKKVWWKCPKGDDHEWESIIGDRSRGHGCPFCAGQKVNKSNSFLVMHPKIAEEWHPTKNGLLKPEQFTSGSQKKVWWKCPKGNDHEYQQMIKHKSNSHGCPFCSGKKVSMTNNLLAVNPKLASEWHPTKNEALKPEQFTSGAGKKVWWKCLKGDDHEWETSIKHRSSGRGCPFCSGKRLSMTNNLLAVNPKLASEWHPTKNNDLKPEHFTSGVSKKVWWQCPKVDEHEWQARILNRHIQGNGCPFCSGSGTSKPEIRILSELKYLFGSEMVLWKSRKYGIEIDIFIKKYNIGIEYDGSYWHKKKVQSDTDKNQFFSKKDIEIIRVRERPLKVISKNDLVVSSRSFTKNDLNSLVLKIKSIMIKPIKIDFESYIDSSSFCNKKEFNRYISYLPSPPPEFSILKTNPEIAAQWHFDKNSPLKPEDFTHGSHSKVWWKCTKGDDHEWKAIIKNRIRGDGCPFCSGRRAHKSNNFLLKCPAIASEWHPTKNKNLKPDNFTFKSNKKVWWQCSKLDEHEWQARIADRSDGSKCPYCSGTKTLNYDLFK